LIDHRPWTEADRAVLRELYPGAGFYAVAIKLRRAIDDVQIEAAALGLQAARPPGYLGEIRPMGDGNPMFGRRAR